MQLVEQLHTKRTDAQHLLRSRKRKLAELFTATACTGDLSAPQANQFYLQQLQAFQDANDLTKGRSLDESTLPARPNIRYQLRHASPRPAHSDSLKGAKNLGRPSTSSQTHLRTPEPLRQNASASSTRPLSPADKTKVSVGSENESKAMLGDGRLLAKDSGQSITTKAEIEDVTGRNSVSNPSPAKQSRSTWKDGRRNEDGNDEQDGGNDAMLGQTTEPQSSPASSNGPGSSNTPIPTAASPTTSVGGDELTTGSAILDADKANVLESAAVAPPSPIPQVSSHVHKLSISSLDVDNMDIDPTSAFESPTQQSVPQIQIHREASTKPKPPIRVNTQHELGPSFKPQPITSGAFVETPALITGTEPPQKAVLATPVSAVDPSKRATRISSGAIQKKTVSEILGEGPRSAYPSTESSIPSSTRDAFASASAHSRLMDRDQKEKERSKLSTVVFAKPQRQSAEQDTIEVLGKDGPTLGRLQNGDRDYLYTLFESKAYSSRSGNLTHLIQHAHKTITTADHLVDYEYQAQCKVLKCLYQLQNADRWALRQRKRAEEPPRQTSHWDFLLDHAKWMRTDFREERKWKHAAAQFVAEACAAWVAGDPEERRLMQVQIRPQMAKQAQDADVDMDVDQVAAESHPTPDLMTSGEDESVSDDIADPRDITLSAAPAAIFSLGASEFNFATDKTPAFDKMINELPLYEPAKIEPDLAKSNLAERLDARWKTDIVPVSRFAVEKFKLKEAKPHFHKSKYDYDLENSPTRPMSPLPPRDVNVGLFMLDNKHIRDRIHPGHSFRPPSEHPMPTQAFFETRASSQWTPTEDDELRKLVKDYSYNWSLISSCLSPKSLYASSADRRTPWECFERWIGLEGMPADMAKTPYFRTYSGRIEAAGRHIQAQIEEAQRRAGANAPIPARKRTSQPVRVERKRAQRHLAMLDAMRKLAKKREAMRQKQQASAEMAAVRKTNEINNQQRPPLKTPAEWSALKYEREQKMAKQQELYRQQLIAHQRAATAQQQRGPSNTNAPTSNGVPQPNGVARGPNGPHIPMANGHLAVPNGVPRPHPSMMGMPNGMQLPQGMAMPKGMQAQIQANMRAGMTNPQQQARLQEQMLRQAQQAGSHSSPSNPSATMANGHGQSHLGEVNGQPSSSTNLGPNSSSPRQPGVAQALSSGVVPVLAQIASSIRQRHPSMSDEDVQRAASQQLTAWQQQATAAAAGQTPRPRVNQAALNAALGAANAAAHAGNVAAQAAAAAANGGFPQNPSMMTAEQLQQYNQRVRMQQAQQQAARSIQNQMSQNMLGQMGGSPAMAMSRPVSQQGNQPGLSRSATPRDQRNANGTTPTVGTSPTNKAGTPTSAIGGQQLQASPARPTSQQTMHS